MTNAYTRGAVMAALTNSTVHFQSAEKRAVRNISDGVRLAWRRGGAAGEAGAQAAGAAMVDDDDEMSVRSGAGAGRATGDTTTAAAAESEAATTTTSLPLCIEASSTATPALRDKAPPLGSLFMLLFWLWMLI